MIKFLVPLSHFFRQRRTSPLWGCVIMEPRYKCQYLLTYLLKSAVSSSAVDEHNTQGDSEVTSSKSVPAFPAMMLSKLWGKCYCDIAFWQIFRVHWPSRNASRYHIKVLKRYNLKFILYEYRILSKLMIAWTFS